MRCGSKFKLKKRKGFNKTKQHWTGIRQGIPSFSSDGHPREQNYLTIGFPYPKGISCAVNYIQHFKRSIHTVLH